MDFFKLIVVDLIEDLMRTDQDRLQKSLNEDILGEIIHTKNKLDINECIDIVNLKKTDN